MQFFSSFFYSISDICHVHISSYLQFDLKKDKNISKEIDILSQKRYYLIAPGNYSPLKYSNSKQFSQLKQVFCLYILLRIKSDIVYRGIGYRPYHKIKKSHQRELVACSYRFSSGTKIYKTILSYHNSYLKQ